MKEQLEWELEETRLVIQLQENKLKEFRLRRELELCEEKPVIEEESPMKKYEDAPLRKLKMMQCRSCGMPFERTGNAQKWCPRCKKESAKRQHPEISRERTEIVPYERWKLKRKVIEGILCINGFFGRKEMQEVIKRLDPELATASESGVRVRALGYERYLAQKGLLTVSINEKIPSGRAKLYRNALGTVPPQPKSSGDIRVVDESESAGDLVFVDGTLVPRREVKE